MEPTEEPDLLGKNKDSSDRREMGLSLQLQQLLDSNLAFFDTLHNDLTNDDALEQETEVPLFLPQAITDTDDRTPSIDFTHSHPTQLSTGTENTTTEIPFTTNPFTRAKHMTILIDPVPSETPVVNTSSHDDPTNSVPKQTDVTTETKDNITNSPNSADSKTTRSLNRRFSIKPSDPPSRVASVMPASTSPELTPRSSHLSQYLPKYGDFLEITFSEYKMVGEYPNTWIDYTFCVCSFELTSKLLDHNEYTRMVWDLFSWNVSLLYSTIQ